MTARRNGGSPFAFETMRKSRKRRNKQTYERRGPYTGLSPHVT